jgi:hypothetical protein
MITGAWKVVKAPIGSLRKWGENNKNCSDSPCKYSTQYDRRFVYMAKEGMSYPCNTVLFKINIFISFECREFSVWYSKEIGLHFKLCFIKIWCALIMFISCLLVLSIWWLLHYQNTKMCGATPLYSLSCGSRSFFYPEQLLISFPSCNS